MSSLYSRMLEAEYDYRGIKPKIKPKRRRYMKRFILIATLVVVLLAPAVSQAHPLSCSEARKVSKLPGVCYRYNNNHIVVYSPKMQRHVYQKHYFSGWCLCNMHRYRIYYYKS